MSSHVVPLLLALLASVCLCQVDYGQSSTCTSQGGKCMDQQQCDTYSYTTRVTGICPGPSTWQCCKANYGQGASCTTAGGTCGWDTACPDPPLSGLCPGPSPWKCCAQGAPPSPPPDPQDCPTTTAGVTWLYNKKGVGCIASSIGGSANIQARLNSWIADLQALTPESFGCLQSICHVGFVRDQSECGTPSFHCYDPPRAADISKVIWSQVTASMADKEHASTSLTTRLRYIAIDALLRRQFRSVLDGWYNADHADHFHVDDGALPSRYVTGSTSDTSFIQAACRDMLYTNTAVDGVYGPQTTKCVSGLQGKLGVVGNLGDEVVYRTFLYELARKAINGETLY